jgi:hypothetical protein
MPILTSVRTLLAGTALALLPFVPAFAQMQQEPDAGDVARTPLEDFNISSDDIPVVLVTAAQDPYAAAGLTNCNAIVGEIAAIDTVLGADFDVPAATGQSGISEGQVAKSVVGSFIPFRGLVREVSGANAREREVNRAVTAGMVRRGYLKGLGQERGCSYPARPRPRGE